MTTENYDFASNIDMAKTMSNIDCISKQIAEKEDAVICKAFTISIARLLRENGIIPIMTEHKSMLGDRERFIIKSTYDVYFNELDTSEHDAKVRQDFADKIRAHMTKYCHARLEQQYCAMEVIDFIGKLLGEKDFSIDVEEEIKKHDAKVRDAAIDEYSNQLWQVIEKCTVNCKLDFNIDDLHNLEVIIKGLAEELKEQDNESY